MQCKILSASLGRNGRIYKQGAYIEIESRKDAEELSLFGCISIPEENEVIKRKEIEKAKPIRPQQKKQNGGKKKK